MERLSEGRVRLWPATLYGSLEDLLEHGWIQELEGEDERPKDAGLAAARALSSLLFGVSPHDLRVLGCAVSVLAATALLANWLPAARAARVDPMATLRAD